MSQKTGSFILFILVFFCSPATKAQDVTFSHFLYSPSFYNPAATGIDRGLLASLNYRRALMYVPSKFETFATSFDQSLHDFELKGFGGVGAYVVKTQEGEGNLSTLTLGIPISARVEMNEQWTLQAGITSKFNQKTILWNRLVFSDQLNPYYGVNPQSQSAAYLDAVPKVNFLDFDIGLWARYESDPTEQSNSFNNVLDIGVSVQHLPEPNQSFFIQKSILPSKYIFMIRYSHSINDYRLLDRKIQPVFLFESQGPMRDFVTGINYVSPGFNIGGFFRKEQNSLMKFSELILLTGINWNLNNDLFSSIRFNYSADFFLSSKKGRGNISHEISLIFHLPSILNHKNPCRIFF